MKEAFYTGATNTLKKNRGITLIELLVGLTIFSLVIGGLYRTFVSQQKVYVVQDQVVDMQQNLRGAVNQMVKEIRMVGLGNLSMVLPVSIGGRTFNNVINPDSPVNGSVTFLSGSGELSAIAVVTQFGQNQIKVSTLNDVLGNPLFDTNNRKYVSIGGIESHVITSIDSPSKTITLNDTLLYNHPVGTPVFCIRAITYGIEVENGIPTLKRDDNTGTGAQPLADSIENLQFAYFDADGNPTAVPANIRMVRITITARTDRPDADFKEGDHYRRRQVSSNIQLMNMNLGF
ncbi:MAG: prepilin-type N-terminal cleavage/methylation domain-containing protein [Thermodesulfobacteriota bacterium]